jgi:hypothetical protein
VYLQIYVQLMVLSSIWVFFFLHSWYLLQLILGCIHIPFESHTKMSQEFSSIGSILYIDYHFTYRCLLGVEMFWLWIQWRDLSMWPISFQPCSASPVSSLISKEIFQLLDFISIFIWWRVQICFWFFQNNSSDD